MKAIQELLGHATIEMTLRYAHLTPEVKREAVSTLDRVPSVQEHNGGAHRPTVMAGAKGVGSRSEGGPLRLVNRDDSTPTQQDLGNKLGTKENGQPITARFH